MTSSFNPHFWRQQFPALKQKVGDQTAAYLDGPGGTQVPQNVIDAVGGYYRSANSNLDGAFYTSLKTGSVVIEARQAAADFFNASRCEEIAFGQNMTSITFAVSRALSRTWQPGDEIIVTRLDHDANISPWIAAAMERNTAVRWWDIRTEDCTLDIRDLEHLLNERTRVVAVTHASNAVGTIVDIRSIANMVHQSAALLFVDAVHYAPHGPIDVKALDCDFLVASAYKFFGPHVGVFYGKYELLDRLESYKVRPAPEEPPGKWETGTQSFESLAGVSAAIDYLTNIGRSDGDLPNPSNHDSHSRPELLKRAMVQVKKYEAELSRYFLRESESVPGLRVYGITDEAHLERRTPTFAVSLEGYSARQVAQALAKEGIFVWDGHYYAVEVMDRLGLLDKGGLVRIGMVHYNTIVEIARAMQALRNLASN